MEEYDDDGVSLEYKAGKSVTTLIETEVDEQQKLTVTIHPSKGDYKGYVKEKTTILNINVTEKAQEGVCSGWQEDKADGSCINERLFHGR